MPAEQRQVSKQQMDWDRQRRIHDAALLESGAVLTVHNRLELSANQLALTELTGDPLFYTAKIPGLIDRSSPKPRPQDAWLDQTIKSLVSAQLSGLKDATSTKLVSDLRQGGVKTTRDLLAIGSEHTRQIQGVGKKSIKTLGGMIVGNEFNLEWYDVPSMPDIRQVCERVSQVPARVLYEPAQAKYEPLGSFTVLDVLEMTPDTRLRRLRPWRLLPSSINTERIRDTYDRAAIFALRFDALQRTQPTQTNPATVNTWPPTTAMGYW